MEVFIEKENKTKKIDFAGNAKKLLEKLKINPEEVIISRNNDIITLDEKLEKTDKVRILSIISGG